MRVASLALPLSLILALAACGGTTPPDTLPPDGTGNGGGGGGGGGDGGGGGGAGPTAGTPGLRLPAGVRPTRYTLTLVIDPTIARFSGVAEIGVELAARQTDIWLHGQDLVVSSVTATPSGGSPITGTWENVGREGMARVHLSRPVGGRVTLRIEYSAPFFDGLEGLYRVQATDQWYAFTQFEPLAARRAFPSFDEPCFKTPYDVTLLVRADHVAVGNTRVLEEAPAAGGMKRIRFATTEPLPTYLLAWAVGTLDIVEAPPIAANAVRNRPLPFRGVATRGRGPELAYALRETPAIVAALEDWFGIPYPYDKLDVIAVPDFEAGAMENAGAITFRESLLLLGENASARQQHGYAYVMAHELSHMWFGDLVTMPWWDDLWLNEAFATWMETVIVERWRPEYEARVSLLEWVNEAMDADSLESARRIRNPIESVHDIHNAFDDITYAKGAMVLSMFDRFIGTDTFRTGIRQYLTQHRMGNATTEDLAAALTAAAGRDVRTPLMTFLEQPGVPFVEVERVCADGAPAELVLRQRRFLPLGSSLRREQTWQLPICIKMKIGGEVREQCTMLTEAETRLPVEGGTCPDWLMPNAAAAGYFRWSLDAASLAALRAQGLRQLAEVERLSYADSVGAAYAAGSTTTGDALGALEPLAQDELRPLAQAPMEIVEFSWEYLLDDARRPAAQAYARRLYLPAFRRLTWDPPRRGRESDETRMLRAHVIDVLARFSEDGTVRREAVRRGRLWAGLDPERRQHAGDAPVVPAIHANAVAPDLLGIVLSVTAQQDGQSYVDVLLTLLAGTQDAVVRRAILGAIGSVRDPAVAARARALTLDPRVRENESLTILETQLADPRTREAAWQWIKENLEAVMNRIGPMGTYMPWLVSGGCTAEWAADVGATLQSRVGDLPGGPRNLAGATEAIRLCAARVSHHRENARAFFAPAP